MILDCRCWDSRSCRNRRRSEAVSRAVSIVDLGRSLRVPAPRNVANRAWATRNPLLDFFGTPDDHCLAMLQRHRGHLHLPTNAVCRSWPARPTHCRGPSPNWTARHRSARRACSARTGMRNCVEGIGRGPRTPGGTTLPNPTKPPPNAPPNTGR